MSGIAELFRRQGFHVTGSDCVESDTVQRLRSQDIAVKIGHRAENVHGASVVVISSAVKSDNPEVVESKRLRIPVIPRAEMLAELMRGKTAFAVAGTHGKTTTTSMLGTLLTESGLDPTLVIGGVVDAFGGNAKWGESSIVVAEADESDGSFLTLPATYTVVTNIDSDHMDYYGDVDTLHAAFAGFLSRIPFYGKSTVCGDDPGVQAVLSEISKPFVTYGFSENLDYVAKSVQLSGMGSSYVLVQGKKELGSINLNVPGKHNALNSLAALSLALEAGVPFEKLQKAISRFQGVKRRFEVRWKSPNGDRVIVDDYGHHPTEIRATLEAARSAWNGRVVCVFQPHRYSRTWNLLEDFGKSFEHADVILLTDVYPAGEEPIAGASGEAVLGEVKKNLKPNQKVELVSSLEEAEKRVNEIFTAGDIVLCLGAGSIHKLPGALIKGL